MGYDVLNATRTERNKGLEALRTGDPTTDYPFDWDSFVLWYGNKLPKYLWGAWKKDVRPIGFTWQKFMRLLRLLRYWTDIGVMWYKGVLPWKE